MKFSSRYRVQPPARGESSVSLFHLESSRDESQRKSIVAFAADGLNGRCAHAWFGSDDLVEAPHSAHARISAGGIRQCAFAHDVVRDDEAADARELECP